MSAPAIERLWKYVSPEPNSGCWLWMGSLDRDGYGKIGVPDRRTVGAHRLAYELHVGPIPSGLQTDHLCRVRCCVNPAHLELVTSAENTRRGNAMLRGVSHNAKKTHCFRGHEFTEANTALQNEWRRCLECERARGRRRWRAGELRRKPQKETP